MGEWSQDGSWSNYNQQDWNAGQVLVAILTSNAPCGSVGNRAWTRTGTSLQQFTSPSVHTMLDIKSNFLHLPIFSYVFDQTSILKIIYVSKKLFDNLKGRRHLRGNNF